MVGVLAGTEETTGESPLAFEGGEPSLDEEHFDVVFIESKDDAIGGECGSGVFVGMRHVGSGLEFFEGDRGVHSGNVGVKNTLVKVRGVQETLKKRCSDFTDEERILRKGAFEGRSPWFELVEWRRVSVGLSLRVVLLEKKPSTSG